MKKYVMALDQGTTSSRCVVFDRGMRVAAMAQQEGKPTWYLCQNGVCGLPFTES